MSGSRETTFALVYGGDPVSRVIYTSDRLRLLADFSPLCAGHLLLLPVDHYLSFADLMSTPECLGELLGVLDDVIPLYLETFGKLTILEHGSSADMRATACISHAHWHLLPIDGGAIDELIRADGLASVVLPRLTDLVDRGGGSYFLCLDDSGLRLYGTDNPVRGQYLRSVAGRILGIPDPLWDYSLVVRTELLRETMIRTKRWISEPVACMAGSPEPVAGVTGGTFWRC